MGFRLLRFRPSWSALAGMVLALATVFAIFYRVFAPVREVTRKRQALVYQTDHEAVLQACREFQSNVDRARATNHWPSNRRDLWPDFLQRLAPSDVFPSNGSLYIEFGGGMHHFGFVAFPPRDERARLGGHDWTFHQLNAQLWYYDEAKMPPKP